MAAVGLSVPIMAGAAADNHKPFAAPGTTVNTPPQVVGGVSPWLKALLTVMHAAPGGALPNGCADLRGSRICVPHVTVDGVAQSDTAVLERMLSEAARGSGRTAPSDAAVIAALHSATVVQHGIAGAVGDELQFRAGVAGNTAVLQQATTMAQQQLQYYLADPAPARAAGIVPSGMTPQQYFLAPATVAGYERLIGIERQRSALAASRLDPSTWIRQQFSRHDIRINNAPPAFSLSDAYVGL